MPTVVGGSGAADGGARMRRLLVPGLMVVVCVSACGGGGSEAMTSQSSPTPTSPTVAALGGGHYAGVAVTAADVPSGFVEDSLTSAVDSYNQVQATLQSRQFAPPQCGTVSAVTAASAPLGFEVSFSRNSTKESLGEFLAPAGNPSLTDLQSVAESCGTVTASDPAKSLQLGGGVVVVPAPHVAADRTLGLQTTTIAAVTGKPAVTTVSTTYLAETNGTLLSVSAKGGTGGQPVDPVLVTVLFTRAVDRVNSSH